MPADASVTGSAEVTDDDLLAVVRERRFAVQSANERLDHTLLAAGRGATAA